MVTTHLPSSVFLALLPLPSGLAWTICLLIGRSVLNSMDQAPRSAFLALIVLPEERTAVMGIVNILKTLAQSAGPAVTGLLADRGRFWVAFVVAGGLKAGYDVMLLAFFGGRVRGRKENGAEGDGNGSLGEDRRDHEQEGGERLVEDAPVQDASSIGNSESRS